MVRYGDRVPFDETLDLPDRIDAASALNRLSHALVRHRAQPEVLRAIAAEADRLASSIEGEPERERVLEFVNNAKVMEAIAEGGTPTRPDGAFLDMFEDSPVSGSANPLSIGLKIATFAEPEEAIGRVTLNPGWQGAPGRAHGGVVAAIVDEVLGAMLPVLKIVAFTGELTMRFVDPTPMGQPLEFRSWKTGADGRKLYLSCEGTGPDGVFVQAHATFITVDLSMFAKDEN